MTETATPKTTAKKSIIKYLATANAADPPPSKSEKKEKISQIFGRFERRRLKKFCANFNIQVGPIWRESVKKAYCNRAAVSVLDMEEAYKLLEKDSEIVEEGEEEEEKGNEGNNDFFVFFIIYLIIVCYYKFM